MPGISESLFRMRFGSRIKKFEGIPGPRPTFPLGTLRDFLGKNPWEVFANYGDKYGGITLVWFGGRPAVVLNDPQLIKEVLVTRFDDYYKDSPIKAIRPIVQNSLFTVNVPEWNELRAAHPCMSEGFAKWLPTQFPVVQSVVDEHLKPLLVANEAFKILDKMQRLCFDVFNNCVVGQSFEGGFERFYLMEKVANFRLNVPPALLFPPIRPGFYRARRLHYEAYELAVKTARQNPEASNDLVSMAFREGTTVSDTQLATFLSTFQFGGDLSAAAALANTLHQVSCHPELGRQLRQQLVEIFQGSTSPGWEALDQCTLLDHVLRESLRINPPVTVFTRNVLKDRNTQLGDHELPPDTIVVIVSQAVQRSESHWQRPDTFDPSRWENGTVDANPIGSDYFFPFGRGPRMCVGKEFAMFCLKTILGCLLSQVEVKTSGSTQGMFFGGVVGSGKLDARLVSHEVA